MFGYNAKLDKEELQLKLTTCANFARNIKTIVDKLIEEVNQQGRDPKTTFVVVTEEDLNRIWVNAIRILEQ